VSPVEDTGIRELRTWDLYPPRTITGDGVGVGTGCVGSSGSGVGASVGDGMGVGVGSFGGRRFGVGVVPGAKNPISEAIPGFTASSPVATKITARVDKMSFLNIKTSSMPEHTGGL